MESWFRRTVLAILVSACALTQQAYAQDSSPVLEAVVQPDIERREIKEGQIDAENWEMGFFAGVLSFEDFGSNDVYGLRLAYHITEDWFAEANYGVSKLQKSSSESIAGFLPLLTDDERNLSYYNLNLGFNALPGEVFIGRWAFNSSFYFIVGAGNTVFASDEYFTYNFGGGLRLFITDWIAMHWDVRNHLMTHEIFGEEKDIQNLESHLGFTLFF